MPFNPEKKKRGDLVKFQDWNDAIEEIVRLESHKVNRSGNDQITGPLTIDGALSATGGNVSGDLTVKGKLSLESVLEIGAPSPIGDRGGHRTWMQKGVKINWKTDNLFIGLKSESEDKNDAVIAWGDDTDDDLRFINVPWFKSGETPQIKEIMIMKPSGNVGIGTTEPKAKLDIALAPRTGTHPTAVKGLYITGDFKADSDGVEFRNNDATQGIGFGFNTIYAAGSSTNQDLGLKAKGTGEVKVTGKLSVTSDLTVSGKVNNRDISADGLKLDNHTHNGTDSQRVKHSDLTLDGGTNPHRTTAADVGALPISGGTVSGNLSVSGNLYVLGTISPAGSETNKDLVLQGKGSGKVQVNSNAIITGNVGIGTTNPQSNLDVQGDVRVKGSLTTSVVVVENSLYVINLDGSNRRVVELSGTGNIFTANGNAIINGNVGIGTNNPTAKLEVAGNAKVTGDLSVSGKITANSNAIITANVGIGTTNPTAKLHVNDGNAIITGTGNVGIGTNNPTAKLEVAGNAKVTGTLTVNGRDIASEISTHTHNGTNSQKVKHSDLTLDGGTNPHRTTAADVGALSTSGGTVSGNLSVTGAVSFVSAVSVGSQTRQMLNLYSPDYAIGVQTNTQYFRTGGNFAWYKGGSHNDAALNAGTNGTSLMTLDGSGNLSVFGTISPAGNDANKDLVLKAKGTGKVKIDSSAIITGNVGIGTTDPKAKLDVNGSVKFAGNSTIVSRMICGQVFYNTSTSKWQYSTFAESVNIVKMSESHFKIYYGFTVKWTQQLMILATTFEERADHTACVRHIDKDHCVICIINTKDQYQKAQNFSFMIIHYDSPPNSSPFSDVKNESGVVTTAPVNPYSYTL